MTTEPLSPKLLSADWLAFGVAVLALFFQYVFPPLMIVVAAAVFVPSALREMGLLHDADEWTIRIMHRAGFHALLVTALLIFLGHLAPALGWVDQAGQIGPETPFVGETLRRAVVWVFLISYLLQYWGGRQGTFRILLGVAVMNLAPLVGMIRHAGMYGGRQNLFFLTVLGAAGLFVALAFLARSFPRPTGWLLLTLCGVVVVFMGGQAGDSNGLWGGLALVFQVLLIMGTTGLALVRE